MAAGADAPPIVVTVRVGSGVPDGTTITNTAHASTSTPGDDPADNTDDATVDVQAAADLVLDKTHPAGVGARGRPGHLRPRRPQRRALGRAGPDHVVDQLPVGHDLHLERRQLVVRRRRAGRLRAAGDLHPGRRPTACWPGTDAPPLHLTVQTDAALDPGTLTNSATVDSPTTDPVPGNNTDTDDVDIDTSANLSIVKSHTQPARVGDPLTFTLAVTNHGPSERTPGRRSPTTCPPG